MAVRNFSKDILEYTDTIVYCGDLSFPCHRFFLKDIAYFTKQFNWEYKTITKNEKYIIKLHKEHQYSFNIFLNILYKENFLNDDDVLELILTELNDFIDFLIYIGDRTILNKILTSYNSFLCSFSLENIEKIIIYSLDHIEFENMVSIYITLLRNLTKDYIEQKNEIEKVKMLDIILKYTKIFNISSLDVKESYFDFLDPKDIITNTLLKILFVNVSLIIEKEKDPNLIFKDFIIITYSKNKYRNSNRFVYKYGASDTRIITNVDTMFLEPELYQFVKY